MIGAVVTVSVAVAAVSGVLFLAVITTGPAVSRYFLVGIPSIIVELLTTIAAPLVKPSSTSPATFTTVVPETKPEPLTAMT